MNNKLCKIVDAEYMGGHKLNLKFNDGIQGDIDLSPYLATGVFKPLQSENKFKAFSLENGVIAWDDNIDMAPEFLYLQIVAAKNLPNSFGYF